MSKFFQIYAGKDHLEWIKRIELAFSALDAHTASGDLAIDRRLSPRERDISHVDFPSRGRGSVPRACSNYLDEAKAYGTTYTKSKSWEPLKSQALWLLRIFIKTYTSAFLAC